MPDSLCRHCVSDSGPIAATPLDGRRAWLITLGASASNFVTFGMLFSIGLFFDPIEREFDSSTGNVAALLSISAFIYYLAGVIGGRLGDRYGVRRIVMAAAVTMPLGLLLASRAQTMWQMHLMYSPLVGTAVGCCYAPLLGAIGRWFDKQRHLANGIVLAGVGAGTLSMPLIVEALIGRFGWRSALAWVAVIAAVVLGATALVSSEPTKDPTKTLTSTKPTASLRFRVLYLSVIAIGPGFYLPLAFMNDYGVDSGVSSRAAAALVGIIGGSSVATRLLLGWLGARVEPMTQYRASHLVMVASLSIWLFAGTNHTLLILTAVVHGIGWGAWVMATPPLMAAWFGVGDLGGTIGLFYTGLGIGALIGPAMSGHLIDVAGYDAAISVALALAVAGTALTMLPLRSMNPTSD